MRDFRFDDANDLDLLLFRQDGVLSVAQARAHFTESAIRHRLARGSWRRLHRGVLLTTNGAIQPEHRRWTAVLALRGRALLAGPTALALDGARADTSVIHLITAASFEPHGVPAGVVVHRTTVLPDSHIHWMAWPPRTRSPRSVVDAAQWARTDDAARLVIADAFQRRLVTSEELLTVLGLLPKAHRRRLIVRTGADAAGGAHSLAELDYLEVSRRAGLPEPARQVLRRDAAGRRRYLDFLYDSWGVHVEVDGGQHLDAAAWWADMKRQNEVWIGGDRVLRFPAWVVRARPNEVIAQVRAALRAAGWRPRSKSWCVPVAGATERHQDLKSRRSGACTGW